MVGEWNEYLERMHANSLYQIKKKRNELFYDHSPTQLCFASSYSTLFIWSLCWPYFFCHSFEISFKFAFMCAFCMSAHLQFSWINIRTRSISTLLRFTSELLLPLNLFAINSIRIKYYVRSRLRTKVLHLQRMPASANTLHVIA